MNQHMNTGAGASAPYFTRWGAVICFSFKQAIDVCESNRSQRMFYLQDVPKLSKKNLVEYEACAKLSEALLASKGIIQLAFKNMTFDSDVVEFMSKVISDYDELENMFFSNIEFISPENAFVVGQALKRRKPKKSFFLSLDKGDSYLFGPLMEANAVIGGRLSIRNQDATFVDSTRCFRYWTLNASTVTSLVLSKIIGLSDMSLVILMKGLRNVSSLSTLTLSDTKYSPGSLIILKESLSILLKKFQGNSLLLNLGNTGMTDVAIWKISELFLEHNKIWSINLSNITSSISKRIISTRMISNQTLNDVSLTNVQFSDENDFKLLFSALKTRTICPAMVLSGYCFNDTNKTLLQQLPNISAGAMIFA